MKKVTLATSISAVLIALGLTSHTLADSNYAAKSAAQKSAKISLTEAINIAEQATGGQSSEAEFEMEKGVAAYEVEITMADHSEVDVLIDAQSGAILSKESEHDKDDHGKDHDDDDHKDDHDKDHDDDHKDDHDHDHGKN